MLGLDISAGQKYRIGSPMSIISQSDTSVSFEAWVRIPQLSEVKRRQDTITVGASCSRNCSNIEFFADSINFQSASVPSSSARIIIRNMTNLVINR